VAAAIVLGQPDALAEDVASSALPPVPPDRIASIDGDGNIKTTIDRATPAVPSGTRLSPAGAGAPGQLAVAPGRSGWATSPCGETRETRWMELFLRGGTAWDACGRPSLAEPIRLRQS